MMIKKKRRQHKCNFYIQICKKKLITVLFFFRSSRTYGFLDDYAFLIKGLIDYYVASLDTDVLHFAKQLQDKQNELFWDNINGGYFYTEANAAHVVVRMKEGLDIKIFKNLIADSLQYLIKY